MKQLPADTFRGADVPDDIVLAAVERAARHSVPDETGRRPGARWNDILEHLGDTPANSVLPHIRDPMDHLERAAMIRTTPESRKHWILTAKGQEHLTAQKAAGQIALPESPQHRRWREARECAAAQIEGLFDDLFTSMEGTSDLFNDPTAHSDEWFIAAERMQNAAWRVGSAMHCLYEWDEPDEAGCSDVDMLLAPGDDKLNPEAFAARRGHRSGRRAYARWML